MSLFYSRFISRNRHLYTIFVLTVCLALIIGIDSDRVQAESNEATAVHASFGIEYAVPNGPRNIVAEAPGRIWYTATEAGGIGFLEVTSDPTDSIVRYRTEFYGLRVDSQPYDLVYDNGFVWFTLRGIRSLGKIDVVTREIEVFSLLSFGAAPTGIDVDNTGRLWIAQSNGRVSRFDPETETFTEFILPDLLAAAPRMEDVAYQSDRAIWFTMPDSKRVIVYDSIRDRFFDDPIGIAPMGIDIDDRGQIWVTSTDDNLIGRRTITTVSRWIFFNSPTLEGGPTGIVVFTDDDNITQVWVTENKTGSIGRIQLYNSFEIGNREKVGPASPPGNTWGIIHGPDEHIWVADPTRNLLYELTPPYIHRVYFSEIKLSPPISPTLPLP